MSYGFLAVNNSNQVLVSDQTRNLHFIGKATYTNNQGHVYNGGLCKFKYQISSTVPVIPFFTMPTQDYYGITSIKALAGNIYEIELIRSGFELGTNIPEVYVFADPRAATPTDPVGLVVYLSDGTPAFDSRIKPLVVTGGGTVQHPSNPKTGAIPYLAPKYCASDSTTAFSPEANNVYAVPKLANKEIVSYVSLAQAQREVTYATAEDECDGFDPYGNCIGAKRIYSWDSTYWSFYRGGVSRSFNYLTNEWQLRAGWICVSYGCNWRESVDSSFIGIGTGGSSGQGGTWPYSNETINLAAAPFLLSNGARYD